MQKKPSAHNTVQLPEASPASLKRGIEKWDLVLMIINSIIGAGIFGLPSKVYSLTGVYSIAAFFVCAAIVLLFILCFAEVGSRFRSTGGPYTYVLAAFGRTPAFAVGWLLLLSRIFNYATLINLLVTYLSVFHASFGSALGRMVVIILLTGLLAYVNHVGVKNTARISSLLTVAKLLPLALFIITGFFFLQPELFTAAAPPSLPSFWSAILMLVFAFGGFESVMVNSGEIKNPTRTIPFGLLIATATVAVFYILIQLVCIGTLTNLATSEKPLADAATTYMGPAGGRIIAAGALISITGTLNILLLSGSRLPFAFSHEGQFPKLFSFVHPRHQTPTYSLLAVTLLSIVVSIAWSFLTALAFAVIIRVTVYLFVAASLLRLRKTMAAQTGHFHLRGGRVIAFAGILLCFWLLSQAKLAELKNVALLLSVGMVIYFLQKKKTGSTNGNSL